MKSEGPLGGGGEEGDEEKYRGRVDKKGAVDEKSISRYRCSIFDRRLQIFSIPTAVYGRIRRFFSISISILNTGTNSRVFGV